jgi:hypothetical protein
MNYPQQVLEPVSDITAANWVPSTGASLYAMIDEAAPDDSDYIYNLGIVGSECAVGLSAGNAPASNVGNVVTYRIKGDGSSSLTVTLKETTTTIATWTHSPSPTNYTTYVQELSTAQVASIGNFSNLRLYFGATP